MEPERGLSIPNTPPPSSDYSWSYEPLFILLDGIPSIDGI